MSWILKLFSRKKNLIIIVEDDYETALLLSKFLQARGCKVKHAREGLEGLRMIQSDQPQLVLLDVMLPGIDGFETLLKLKSNPSTKQIPVIMCTVLNKVADVEKCCKWGAEGYITKPFELDRIWEKVSSLIKTEKKAW